MKSSIFRGRAALKICAAVSLVSSLMPASLQAIDSNGSGGGNFTTGSTWSGGVVPTGDFQVLPGDTVKSDSSLTYDSATTNNIVRGTLIVGGGSEITMGRLNNGLVVSGSTVQVGGGSLSISRIGAASGSSNNLLRVVSGTATLREPNLVTGSHLTVQVDADGHFLAGGSINGPLTLNGGTVYFANNAKLTSNAVVWNGGTIVLSSGAAYNSFESNTLFNAWKTNDANVLALSDETSKRTVTLGSSGSNPTISATQGTLSFNVYSATNNDNDQLALAGTSSLSLSSGVDLRVEAPLLTGTPSNYVGRTYKLFNIATGYYANLTPTVTTTRWVIGGTGYQVNWTNTLASNGSLTVASLTPIGAIDAIAVSDFNLPAQNAQGWTILTPASDSRLIYVDPVSGNDSTGTYYLPGAAAVGSNPQSPVGPILAVKTLAKAKTLLGDDKPDWLLLKAGGVWTGQSLNITRGRSATERTVVCAYGSGARPELRTGASNGIANAQLTNVIIQGIRFWAHTRDKDGPYFTSYAGGNGLSLSSRIETDVRQVRDVLIEDCVFRSYANNTLIGNRGSAGDTAPITRVVLRRSIISGNYKDSGGHSQGLYLSNTGQPLQPTVLLQENTFYHNGWRIQADGSGSTEGRATMFNHNTYFTDAKGVIFEKNIFLMPSSIQNKWTATYLRSAKGIVLRNNLYVDGEIGISMGGNAPYTSGLRFANVSVRDNVFTDIGRSRPTNRSLSWGVDAKDWDHGFVTDNLVIHQRDTGITNTYGLLVTAEMLARDVFVGGNVFANLRAGTGVTAGIVHFKAVDKMHNVTFEDNVVQSPTATPLVRLESLGVAFRGVNQYHSAASASQLFSVNGAYANLASWKTATGDVNAFTTAPSFTAPTRDVEGYTASLGLGSTFQHFVNAVHGQSKANWNPALTAPAVNNWLRAGFGLPPVN